jgi:hypothetical protein
MSDPSQLSKPDTDLLPCPFCGGEAEFAGYAHEPDCYVYCGNDNCFGPRTTAGNLHDAAIQWNTRAAVPAQGQPEPASTTGDYRASKYVEKSESKTYTAGIDAMRHYDYCDRQWHICAVQFHHKDEAEAVKLRDRVLTFLCASPPVPPQDSLRAALNDIVSWREDTLGKRPKEPHPFNQSAELTEAFDRGARMAFYRCADRAKAALAIHSQEGKSSMITRDELLTEFKGYIVDVFTQAEEVRGPKLDAILDKLATSAVRIASSSLVSENEEIAAWSDAELAQRMREHVSFRSGNQLKNSAWAMLLAASDRLAAAAILVERQRKVLDQAELVLDQAKDCINAETPEDT